jgi:nucleotide-binding universal stress UspA family protein
MKTILVPTDFSKEADNALEVAAIIARNTGAKIELLHIVESIHEDAYSVSGTFIQEDGLDKVFILKMIEKATMKMKQKAKDLSEEGIKVMPHVKVGSVYKHISSIISENKVDLIVMGTQGATGLKEMFSGSNTQKVVRLAKCLVLSVKERANKFSLKNVLFATNFQDDAPVFLDRIKELQSIFNFKLHILYVNTPMSFQSDMELSCVMDDFAKTHKLNNFNFNVINAYTEEEGIMIFADKVKADIVALSTHGRKGLSSLLMGSVSKDLVNYSPKPILTYNVNSNN